MIAAVAAAETVFVASLLNLDAVGQAIPAGTDVTVVCSGTDGRFALEDAYAAGRVVELLAGARSDAAQAAARLAAAYVDPRVPLSESADDGAVLQAWARAATSRSAEASPCSRSSRG